MAFTDNQAIMVIHQEDMTTSALASQASSAQPLFVVLKPLDPGCGGQDEGALAANKDASPLGTSTVGFQNISSVSLSAMAGTNSSNQLMNLPAEITCKGITVTLDNNNMWNEFYRCKTEMILTKQGRRMFPCCRFRISGLEPFQRYTLVMDMHPVDNHRYKWSDRQWETNGRGDPHIVRSFVHPESPATGLDWMQNPISFYKLKLTNNTLDHEGHIIINSMHRYLPRLHIIPADKATDVDQLNGPDVITFSFPQTEFFAVTAYQNLCITQLKIDYNPFAKGFREDANNSRSFKPKNGLSSERVDNETKSSRETTTLNNLKTLFAKRNSTEKLPKGQTLPVSKDEEVKPVNGDTPTTTEMEKNSSKKRPWAESLSELIKGTHVKARRMSLEKSHDCSEQQMNTSDLPAGEEKIDAASKDCEMENISIIAVNSEEMEVKNKLLEASGTTDVQNVAEAEGPVNSNTVLVSKTTDLSTIHNAADSSVNMNTDSGKCPDTSIHENIDITLRETRVREDGDTSQAEIKPLDCGGEIRKKRAEPVPLPLLALFLQQLKSKTRPSRKPNVSSSLSYTDESCKTVNVAENLSPSTASCLSPSPTIESASQPVATLASETITSSILKSTIANTAEPPCLSSLPVTSSSLSPSLTTQSSVQPASSPTSEAVTSFVSTCTVANTTETLSLSLSATSSSIAMTTSPTLPDMPTPSLSPSLIVIDPGQVPDLTLAEHKAASTLDHDTNVIASATNIVSDTVFENAPTTLSSESNSSLSDTDNVLSDVPCAKSPSPHPVAFPASISDCSKNDDICSSVLSESSSYPALDSGIVLCPELVPEASFQSFFSDDDNDDIPFSPSSPAMSIPSSAPSSPDPFPPDLFSSRPIPPRKSLDPFPSCLAFGRERPVVDIQKAVPLSLFVTKTKHQRDSGTIIQSVSTEPNCPPPDTDCSMLEKTEQHLQESKSISKETEQPLLESTNISKETEQSLQESTSISKENEQSLQESTSISKENEQSLQENTSMVKETLQTAKKSNVKHRKSGKLKLNDYAEVTVPISVPMQPNLEDVEGQLFVSFVSKKALKVHLGGEDEEEAKLPKTTNNAHETDEDDQSIEERIDSLENELLHDLKMMKHRQVIHPVLQAVGLKLNLLDHTLPIDLQYLGVCLPIPPPIPVPGDSSENSSSQAQFVSRTGKTTDFTKIKGWRDKFATSGSSSLPGGTSSDAGQKNLSAFCSDMLDEYLESEGKLIDERAASFSQAVVTPVAYQLPTKSTSYVRTLDSVLKKQGVPPVTTTLKSPSSKKSTPTCKNKELGENASKKSFRSGGARSASNTEKLLPTSSIARTKQGEKSSKKSPKPGISKPVYNDSSAPCSLSPNKKSKGKDAPKTLQASIKLEGNPTITNTCVTSSSPGSVAGGRSPGLSKALVKLLDVEDGAVWEGKRRTCITEERAAIALSSLVTAEGTVKGNPSTIIRRRAPPCLNDFCRLGCVCASLAQERRQHHCGKQQCMLGCSCLRRKMVLLRKDTVEGPELQCQNDDSGIDVMKKKKKKAYTVLSGPEAAPEPATLVQRLWDPKNDSEDSESIFTPSPARPQCPSLSSPDLQCSSESVCSSPKEVMNAAGLRMYKGKKENQLDCARVRPFCRKDLSNAGQCTKNDPHPIPEESPEEMEEGELRPPALSGPTKRLEIVSKCEWATEGSRNVVLRVVCDRMAQNRLTHPFWVGKFHIEPISKSFKETDEGTTVTYKISISQPPRVKHDPKKEENENENQLEDQLIKTIGKSEVKGLPLLSHVTPAGLLKAEKKPPSAPGTIQVNGKPYPQAKLELGQMGALHPANRLAAYITGRVSLTSQNDTKTLSTATSSTTPTTLASTTTVVTSTTTVTSACSSTVPVKPIVTKPPVGKVFTQVVINHLNSQQRKLPSTSAPKLLNPVRDIIKPSSSLMTGVTGVSVVSISPNTPPKTNVVFQTPPASGPTGGTAQVNSVPVPFSLAAPAKPPLVGTTAPRTVTPGGGVRFMQPVTTSNPFAPGQRMVFQMLKTSNGSTLYRNPNGQLIQLVPLNQFKALNPNFLIPKQTTIVRFPSSSASKPQTGSSATTTLISTPVTPTTLFLQSPNPTPVRSTTAVSTTSTITSSVAIKPVISLAGSNSSPPSTVGVVPRIITSPGKSIIKIIPQSAIKDQKDPIITVTSTPPSQSTSNLGPTRGGVTLVIPQSSVTTKNHPNSTPSEGSGKDMQSSGSENVVRADHCYTSETKISSTLSEQPGDLLEDAASSTDVSASDMPLEDKLDFAPVEEDEELCGTGVAVGPEVGSECEAEFELDVGEIDSDCSELTEDSDMYNMSSSTVTVHSDQEDLSTDTESDEGERNEKKRVSVDAEIQDDDNDLLDVETYDDERSTTSPGPFRNRQQRPRQRRGKEGLAKMDLCRKQKQEKKNEQEMERRSALTECFHKMRLTLNHEDSKASRMTLLQLAQGEIHTLKQQKERLLAMEREMKKKRARYLQKASLLSGKSKESIFRKLIEIVDKQKSLEAQERTKASKPQITRALPKPTMVDVKKKQKSLESKGKGKDALRGRDLLSPNSKPMDRSVHRWKKQASQDVENVSVKQKVTEAQKEEKESISIPSEAVKTLKLNTTSALPIPQVESDSSLALHEKTRPYILSRSKCQALQVSETVVPQIIPLVETVVPCNQIITISKPISISSSSERQSVTPGVAAVSLSVPAISHPIRVENPVPVLQPQVRGLASNTLKVNTPVKAVNLPKISSVVSLVHPEKLLVTPPAVVQQTEIPPVVQTQADSNPVHMEAQQNLDLASPKEVPAVGEGQDLEKQVQEVLPDQSEQGAAVSVADTTTNQTEEETNAAHSETEDENLMSLLDELVFLNQQALSPTKTDSTPTDLVTEDAKGVDRDDDRSLSPLFLRLDEDLIGSTSSKDEIDDIPPKLDDLVKVIFGSDSPPNSSESESVARVSDDGTSVPVCHAKSDAPSPPPLLQMKAGGGSAANSLNEQASVSWRPMPKLAPLGLKTQEAGQPNVVKPGSKPPSLRSAHT